MRRHISLLSSYDLRTDNIAANFSAKHLIKTKKSEFLH